MKSRAPSKRRLGKQDKLPMTPFEEQARQLAEKRRKLEEELAKCQEIVKSAPVIKREQEKIRRQQIEERRAKKSPVPGSRVLVDPRGYIIQNLDNPKTAAPRLRRERSQGRITFFVLLGTLVAVLAWAYFTLSGPAQ